MHVRNRETNYLNFPDLLLKQGCTRKTEYCIIVVKLMFFRMI